MEKVCKYNLIFDHLDNLWLKYLDFVTVFVRRNKNITALTVVTMATLLAVNVLVLMDGKETTVLALLLIVLWVQMVSRVVGGDNVIVVNVYVHNELSLYKESSILVL